MRFLKMIGCLVALAIFVAVIWLGLKPPELLRVGTGYAAKIVCSNVFIAKREPGVVLKDDVQAPGHPLLKLVNVSIDRSSHMVTAQIFGFFAPSRATYRPGLGCANIQTEDLRPSLAASAEIKPVSLDVDLKPAVQAVISDPELAGPGMRAIVVIKDGRLIAESYGVGIGADTPLLGWSMTKSVMATLIGMRVAKGRMDIRRKNLLPAWSGDERSKITLANLMAMESGLHFDEDYGNVTDVTRMLFLEQDMAGFAASKPLEALPGEKFNYSSGTANILSQLFMDSFDSRAEALAYPRHALFGPLGMSSALLEADATGTFVGSSYMYATARDWARLAGFLIDNGTVDGRQILPAGFVSFMRQPTQSSSGLYGQGQVWLQISGVRAGENGIPADAFWMSGHDGQSVMIVPSMNLAVVRLGLSPSKTHYNVQGLNSRIIKALHQVLE